MAFVLRPIPALGIKVVVEIRLLEVLNPVDMHQDWFGLRCGSELEVHLPNDVRDGVDAIPLLNELPVCCPGSGVKVYKASVPIWSEWRLTVIAATVRIALVLSLIHI